MSETERPSLPAATAEPSGKLVHDMRGSLHALLLHLRVLDHRLADQPELRELVQRALRGGRELEQHITQLKGRG